MSEEKKASRALQIQPLNDDVLANLSIEELEERLEMQILHLTEAQACYDCGVQCNCNAQCGAQTCAGYSPPCNECVTLCTLDGSCISNGGGGGGGGGVEQPM